MPAAVSEAASRSISYSDGITRTPPNKGLFSNRGLTGPLICSPFVIRISLDWALSIVGVSVGHWLLEDASVVCGPNALWAATVPGCTRNVPGRLSPGEITAALPGG